MKNIKYLAGAVIALLTLWGCNENDSDYVIGSNPNEFAVNPVAIPVSADGGVYELTITGNESWTAGLTGSNSSASDWCILSETSGTGKKVITVTVKPSTSFVKLRSLIIEVSAGNRTLKSRVLQETMVLGEDEVLINGLVWSTKNVGAPGTFASSPTTECIPFNRKMGHRAAGPALPGRQTITNEENNWLPENDLAARWLCHTLPKMRAVDDSATCVSKAQTGFATDGLSIGVPASVAQVQPRSLKQLGCVPASKRMAQRKRNGRSRMVMCGPEWYLLE